MLELRGMCVAEDLWMDGSVYRDRWTVYRWDDVGEREVMLYKGDVLPTSQHLVTVIH